MAVYLQVKTNLLQRETTERLQVIGDHVICNRIYRIAIKS